MIVGVAGTLKTDVAFGNVIVIVSPLRRLPVPLRAKLTVQVARALAASVVELNVTPVTVVAAAIVTAAGLPAVVSALVLTCQRLAAGVPAAPAMTPRIWNVAAVLSGSEQVPPLSASVIVTVCAAPVAVRKQLLKPLVGRIVGVAGTEKIEVAFGKVTVIVSPLRSQPVAVEVKPTVHVPRALARDRVRVERDGGRLGRGGIVTAAGLATVVSALVLTFQRLAAGVPAAPAVTPRIWSPAAALFGREQLPPLSLRVIVTVCPAPVAVAAQLRSPWSATRSASPGPTKTDVAFGKTTVTVSPAWSVPVAEEVKPTVQVPRARAASVVEANVTAVGVVAAAITTFAPGLTALVASTDVLTLKVVFSSEPAAGFVSPASWKVAGVLGATAQVAPDERDGHGLCGGGSSGGAVREHGAERDRRRRRDR